MPSKAFGLPVTVPSEDTRRACTPTSWPACRAARLIAGPSIKGSRFAFWEAGYADDASAARRLTISPYIGVSEKSQARRCPGSRRTTMSSGADWAYWRPLASPRYLMATRPTVASTPSRTKVASVVTSTPR